MNLRAALVASAACSALAGPAAAETFTLDFDQWGEVGDFWPDPDEAELAAGITYDYTNYLNYGEWGPSLLLSDGGWHNDITFRAAPGTTFTPKRFDLLESYQTVFTLSYANDYVPAVEAAGGEPAPLEDVRNMFGYYYPGYEEDGVPFAHDNLIMRGLRDGKVVVETSLNTDEAGEAVAFGDGFADIDALFLGLRFYGESGEVYDWTPSWMDQDSIFFCDNGQSWAGCGGIRIDNLVVDVADPVIAPVSLPAGGALLAGGLLAGLAPLGWRARRRPRP